MRNTIESPTACSVSPALEAEILRLHAGGSNPSEIGALLRVPYPTISLVIARAGHQVPDADEFLCPICKTVMAKDSDWPTECGRADCPEGS